MRVLSFLIFITLSLHSLNAQKPVYGLRGGTNFSTINTSIQTPYEYSYKAGFQFGGLVKLKLSDQLFLQPELLYSLQGTKYNINLSDTPLPQDPDDSYFQGGVSNVKTRESTMILPIILKYYFNDKFNFQIGPQFDYIFYISADHVENDGGEIVVNGRNNYSVSDFNWGLTGGLGVDFNMNFGLDLRYNYGFNREETGDVNFRFGNSVFQINLEYRFVK